MKLVLAVSRFPNSPDSPITDPLYSYHKPRGWKFLEVIAVKKRTFSDFFIEAEGEESWGQLIKDLLKSPELTRRVRGRALMEKSPSEWVRTGRSQESFESRSWGTVMVGSFSPFSWNREDSNWNKTSWEMYITGHNARSVEKLSIMIHICHGRNLSEPEEHL